MQSGNVGASLRATYWGDVASKLAPTVWHRKANGTSMAMQEGSYCQTAGYLWLKESCCIVPAQRNEQMYSQIPLGTSMVNPLWPGTSKAVPAG
jgi:hypothetical protein